MAAPAAIDFFRAARRAANDTETPNFGDMGCRGQVAAPESMRMLLGRSGGWSCVGFRGPVTGQAVPGDWTSFSQPGKPPQRPLLLVALASGGAPARRGVTGKCLVGRLLCGFIWDV
ncbi:hypothetical protein GCM10010394_36180 [Streptomyces crystallinus]|uniref:Uncharacterized protein n=1 Tax=Streptomyces crystallinus TaxID=68191 RepID=A0ABN1G3B8_9ACTN